MNILITGIAGFIGYHLAKQLQGLEHTLFGVDNLGSAVFQIYRPNMLTINGIMLKI